VNGSAILPRLLRAVAVAIALAGALDPVVTSNRSTRPEVSVIAIDPHRDSALAARVARTLGTAFTVTSAPFAAAGAAVLVGDRLPDAIGELVAPTFAVMPEPVRRSATIEEIQVPAWAALNGRVPVNVVTRVTGAIGGRVRLTLRLNGVVVDQVEQDVPAGEPRRLIPLAFTPIGAGVSMLQVTATVPGSPGQDDTGHVDAAVDVRDRPWSVLCYDPRPSWPSTFVRRALEEDDRVVVTSRVITSRNISTDAGKPPASLEDESALDAFDAIVVGAPDALTDRDVTGLDRFLRRRGGSVILLLDQPAAGPWQRLADAGKWLDREGRLTSVGAEPGDTTLKGSAFAWPGHLPPGAEPLALTLLPGGDTTARHPVIWRSPVGAGQLIVSGALDAWRYRDPVVSRFDDFWRNLIVDAASAAPAPVTVTLSNTVVAPGELVTVTVAVRDAELHALPMRTAIATTIAATSGDGVAPVRLWPGGSVGELAATLRAPAMPGSYRITATADGRRGEALLMVATGATHVAPDGRDLLDAWVSTHGGTAVPAGELAKLPAALKRATPAASRREPWHPFRTIWWLAPFALALSGEWWWRRRRGLP
jgi:hypothetical protein